MFAFPVLEFPGLLTHVSVGIGLDVPCPLREHPPELLADQVGYSPAFREAVVVRHSLQHLRVSVAAGVSAHPLFVNCDGWTPERLGRPQPAPSRQGDEHVTGRPGLLERPLVCGQVK